MQPIWMSIEPSGAEVRLLVSEPGAGPALKARLPLPAPGSRAVLLMLEAISLWYAKPLHVVLDADAGEVALHPDRWAALAGDLPLAAVSIEWARRPSPSERKRRGRYLDEIGHFNSARRLLGNCATGLP